MSCGAVAPVAPRTLAEAGLSPDLITQLVLKTLHLSGELSGTELAKRVGLPFFAIEPVLATIKQTKDQVADRAEQKLEPLPDLPVEEMREPMAREIKTRAEEEATAHLRSA